MARFRDAKEFGPTLDAAAEHLRISATPVEKDYWVSQTLRVLTDAFAEDFIFKGGTSLSKAYRIIERFSEDIDILVLPGERGRAATDKLMKTMGNAAAAGIGGEASKFGGSETGRHRSYELAYPAIRKATPMIRTSVLLEMGVRGGPHPHERVPINSLLGDALATRGTDLSEFADLEPFEVLVLHPGRTLLEKLVHIHELAQELPRGTRAGRPRPQQHQRDHPATFRHERRHRTAATERVRDDSSVRRHYRCVTATARVLRRDHARAVLRQCRAPILGRNLRSDSGASRAALIGFETRARYAISYGIRTPEMARAITRRRISEVPSEIV